MSHVADVDIKIKDLEAFAAAVKALGGEWNREATEIQWYGRFLDDWSSDRAARNRIDPTRFGKTDKGEITFPGCSYSMGLLKNDDGSFTPYYDTYGGGRGLTAKLGGMDCPKLKDEYAAAVSMRTLARKGFRVTRTTGAKGEIVLKARN